MQYQDTRPQDGAAAGGRATVFCARLSRDGGAVAVCGEFREKYLRGGGLGTGPGLEELLFAVHQ